MKNISELITAHEIAKVKAGSSEQTEVIANIFNQFYSQLTAVFPASVNALKNEKEIESFKQQWLQAFKENNINKIEYIRAGMRVARQQKTPFLPSVGQFIEWCERGLALQYGLPTADELMELFSLYCSRKGFEDFDISELGTDLNYWLVVDLHQIGNELKIGRQKLTEQADALITKMAKKLMNGYVVPSVKKALPKAVKSKPLTKDE